MPQLDSTTFFGQVTWLVIVFVSYFLVVRGDIFPSLTRLLKVRAKKKTHATAMSNSHQAEAKSVMQRYDATVGSAAMSALSLIQTELDNQASWSKQTLDTIMTSGDRGSASLDYLNSIAEVEGDLVTSIEDLDDLSLEDVELEDDDASAATAE